jgi:hypothetical protein
MKNKGHSKRMTRIEYGDDHTILYHINDHMYIYIDRTEHIIRCPHSQTTQKHNFFLLSTIHLKLQILDCRVLVRVLIISNTSTSISSILPSSARLGTSRAGYPHITTIEDLWVLRSNSL